MSSRFCHHVHENGGFCQSPPVQKRNYCYFHLEQLGRRMQMARARSKGERVPFTLPLLEDLYSVQVAVIRLADAIAAGDIEPKRAQILLSVLRLAASNLKGQGWTPFRRFAVDDNVFDPVVTYPGFENAYGLPNGLDLSQPPEVAFPPPPSAAANDKTVSQHLEERTTDAGATSSRRRCERVGGTSSAPAVEITIADIAVWRRLHEAGAPSSSSAVDGTIASPESQQAAATALSKPGGSNPDSPEQRLRRRALELVAQGRAAQVTPFDVELMEIYQSEGEAAMIERVKRHTADERRAEQRRRTRQNRERFAAEARVRNAANLATQLLSEQPATVAQSMNVATQPANSDPGKKPPHTEPLPGLSPAGVSEA